MICLGVDQKEYDAFTVYRRIAVNAKAHGITHLLDDVMRFYRIILANLFNNLNSLFDIVN